MTLTPLAHTSQMLLPLARREPETRSPSDRFDLRGFGLVAGARFELWTRPALDFEFLLQY